MKACTKCGQLLELAAFYRHPGMRDGRLNKCKECHKADVNANRREHVERYRAYDRARGSRQGADYVREHRRQHPERTAAHNAVARALRSGRLVKPCACWHCGSTRQVVGHHADYSAPLAVSWLCQACHKAVHVATDQLQSQGLA